MKNEEVKIRWKLTMRAHPLTVIFALLCLCRPGTSPGEEDPGTANDSEAVLKAAKLGTDDASLLKFLRKRTLANTDPDQILALVRQLGDRSFKVRQKASADLVALGTIARPYLSQATKAPDPEIVRRAEECLEQIRPEGSRQELTVAAIRLLAARKPAATIETLLAFLPFAENEIVTGEIQEALVSLSRQGPQARKVLLSTLADRFAVRRAVAAEVLCQSGSPEAQAAVVPLLKDADLTVRLRAAMALALAKHKLALPVLIDLLVKLPRTQAWQAQDMLFRIAGERAPIVSLGTDEAARQKCHDAWLAWWRQNEDHIDLAKLEEDKRLLGYALVVMLDAGKVRELGPDNKVRYEIHGLRLPLDVQFLSEGKLLIAEHDANLVAERSSSGEILWSKEIPRPLMAQRLPNGNTFIATPMALVELDRNGKEVFSHFPSNGEEFMKAQKLPRGEIACVTGSRGGPRQFVRLDSSGRELQHFPVNVLTSGGRIDVLPGGRVLVPERDENRVVEYDAEGKIVWQASYPQPVAAVRLPNGHTLVTSFNADDTGIALPADRLVPAAELDRTGRVVWKYKGPSRVTRVLRR
jgi:hypothetical protein